jgi:hypothetical protein
MTEYERQQTLANLLLFISGNLFKNTVYIKIDEIRKQHQFSRLVTDDKKQEKEIQKSNKLIDRLDTLTKDCFEQLHKKEYSKISFSDTVDLYEKIFSEFNRVEEVIDG